MAQTLAKWPLAWARGTAGAIALRQGPGVGIGMTAVCCKSFVSQTIRKAIGSCAADRQLKGSNARSRPARWGLPLIRCRTVRSPRSAGFMDGSRAGSRRTTRETRAAGCQGDRAGTRASAALRGAR